MSFAVTGWAPAPAAATATRPEPVARSRTARPETRSGWSRMWRARAWPPAHAKAQKGGGWAAPDSSVFSHNAIGSAAWWRVISGTNGAGAQAGVAGVNSRSTPDCLRWGWAGAIWYSAGDSGGGGGRHGGAA